MAWAVAAVLLLFQAMWLPAMAQADFASLPPDEKMARRFPQPVRVGDLIGLPVLDEQDSHHRLRHDEVVRTPDGKIVLIVPYGAWFGWARDWAAAGRRADRDGGDSRPADLNALEMPREDFDKAPTFVAVAGDADRPRRDHQDRDRPAMNDQQPNVRARRYSLSRTRTLNGS